MAKATFLTGLSGPHDGWSGSPIITAASTVFIEGKAAARVGDIAGNHYRPLSDPHILPKISIGSSTVFIEGKAAARIGDNLECGSKIITGASTVEIG